MYIIKKTILQTDELQNPGGHSLIWPIRGRAAGQGMVFDLSALNRVYNFIRTCPKQGMFF